MYVRLSVRAGDLFVVNFAEPVVCGYCSGVGKYQSAYRIGYGAVFLYAPVVDLKIIVDDLFVIEKRALYVTRFFALFPVEDVRLGDVGVTRLDQDGFHGVLNVLDGYHRVLDLGIEIRGNAKRQKFQSASVIHFVQRIERLGHRADYLVDIEFDDLSFSVDYSIHNSSEIPYVTIVVQAFLLVNPFINILWFF